MASTTIQQIGRDIAVLETKLDNVLVAIDKQAKEYERRLQELNHAHQQQMDRNATYIPRETYEANEKTYEARFANLSKQVNDIDTWKQTMNGVREIVTDLNAWKQRLVGIQIGIAIGSGLTGGGVVALIFKVLGKP
jgi:hypothetical protein